MATKNPQPVISDTWELTEGGSDFSGIVKNIGEFPIEIAVFAGSPDEDLRGFIIGYNSTYPIKIPADEQLYHKRITDGWDSYIQLV